MTFNESSVDVVIDHSLYHFGSWELDQMERKLKAGKTTGAYTFSWIFFSYFFVVDIWILF